MKVIVASRNPVKINAVRAAFSAHVDPAALAVEGVAAASGVSEQPVGDSETRRGARNRIASARDLEPAADYWVGLEGGIETLDGALLAFAWMAVMDSTGRIGMSRSATLPLPPAIQKLVAAGMELGEANDRVFATHNSKQAGGAFGLLTDGLLTRESIYRETVLLALIPLLHPLFADEETGGSHKQGQ